MGYKRIREGFEAAGMKQPMIEQVDGGVRVTVWRKNVPNDVLNEGNNVANDVANGGNNVVNDVANAYFTDRQKAILNLMQTNPCISRDSIAEIIGFGKKTIERDIEEMRKHMNIEFKGFKGGDNKHWEISPMQ